MKRGWGMLVRGQNALFKIATKQYLRRLMIHKGEGDAERFKGRQRLEFAAQSKLQTVSKPLKY